jgi:hypothetical protein
MSESFNDPSVHPFTCKLPDGSVIGGSYDNLSAVTIACTLYAIIQAANPTTTGSHQVSVHDATDTVIAVIGRGA